MPLDKRSYTGRSVLVLKFELIGSTNSDNNYVYNTLVVGNMLNTTTVCRTLIDTGASFPVWAKEVDLLLSLYPQATEAPYKAWLGGFGGDGSVEPVWRIPRFILSDGSESIAYEDLHVAVHPMQSNFDMVVSFPMLRHAVITYVTPGNKCTPVLQIKRDRSVILSHPSFLYVKGEKYMDGLNVFVQGDYDIGKLEHDPSTLIAVMEKHSNYEEWFNDNFPNGASSADEVIQRLEEESRVSS